MSFFSSIPTWGWFDIGFNVVVLVALGGETDIILRWVFQDSEGELLPPETKRKELKKFCEWLLIFGIAGEICCLPFSLYGTASAESEAGKANERASTNELEAKRLEAQIMDTSNNVVKNDPLNRPISNVSATAEIEVKGAQFSEPDLVFWEQPAVSFLWMYDINENFVIGLQAFNYEKIPITSFSALFIPQSRKYLLDFDMPATGYSKFRKYRVKDILDKIDKLRIETKFMPTNAEIISGSVTIRINDSSKDFQILPQTVVWDITPDSSGTSIRTTNSIP